MHTTTSRRLAKANGIAGVFQWEIDAHRLATKPSAGSIRVRVLLESGADPAPEQAWNLCPLELRRFRPPVKGFQRTLMSWLGEPSRRFLDRVLPVAIAAGCR